MIYEFKSSKLFLLLNGKLKDFFCPWILKINFEDEYITISKRNWYLVGFNEIVNSFKYIRSIKIYDHFFGSDIEITASGNNSFIFSISKKEVRQIRDLFISYNKNNSSKIIRI
jgi:hypothetical protein